MSASSPHPGTVAVGDYELVRQRVAGEVAGRRRALRSSRPLLIGRADPRRSAHSVALVPDRDPDQERADRHPQGRPVDPEGVPRVTREVDDREHEREDATIMSRTNRGASIFSFSARRHLICAAAEKPSGIAAVIPVIKRSTSPCSSGR